MKRFQMKYEAVIFDFDGVIGKTMGDNYRAWSKAFNHHNIQLGEEEYFLLEGMNAGTVAETILKKNNMDTILAEEIADQKERYYLEENSFEFYRGVLKLIEALQARFKLGLVSGASSGRLKETVPERFLKKFGAVVTGDLVKKSKPHPEPYIVVGKKLAVVPKDCLAVENAPFGIESAKIAGMDCIAVCSTLKREHLCRADFIVEDIDSLITFFDMKG